MNCCGGIGWAFKSFMVGNSFFNDFDAAVAQCRTDDIFRQIFRVDVVDVVVVGSDIC